MGEGCLPMKGIAEECLWMMLLPPTRERDNLPPLGVVGLAKRQVGHLLNFHLRFQSDYQRLYIQGGAISLRHARPFCLYGGID